jgi:hypothetical protein
MSRRHRHELDSLKSIIERLRISAVENSGGKLASFVKASMEEYEAWKKRTPIETIDDAGNAADDDDVDSDDAALDAVDGLDASSSVDSNDGAGAAAASMPHGEEGTPVQLSASQRGLVGILALFLRYRDTSIMLTKQSDAQTDHAEEAILGALDFMRRGIPRWRRKVTLLVSGAVDGIDEAHATGKRLIASLIVFPFLMTGNRRGVDRTRAQGRGIHNFRAAQPPRLA